MTSDQLSLSLSLVNFIACFVRFALRSHDQSFYLSFFLLLSFFLSFWLAELTEGTPQITHKHTAQCRHSFCMQCTLCPFCYWNEKSLVVLSNSLLHPSRPNVSGKWNTTSEAGRPGWWLAVEYTGHFGAAFIRITFIQLLFVSSYKTIWTRFADYHANFL